LAVSGETVVAAGTSEGAFHYYDFALARYHLGRRPG
jgi:hypothetical protein